MGCRRSTRDWVRVPVGGAGTLCTFLALAAPNSSKLAVLVDARTRDSAPVRRLVENEQLKNGSLVILSEITGIADADIEDLFEPDFYLQLVNRAYEQDLGERRSEWKTSPRTIARITKRIERCSPPADCQRQARPFLPARELLRGQSERCRCWTTPPGSVRRPGQADQ